MRESGAPEYRFVDRWRVKGTCREVADILARVTEYPRWWPSTYIAVTEDDAGDENGVGKSGTVHAQGWLPYRIRFAFRVLEVDYPWKVVLSTTGDLTGQGIWDLSQDGDWVDVTYTWTIRADKAVLRHLSFVLKPVFRSNHNWTMRRGGKSLDLELQRTRATTAEALARIPDPPGPVPRLAWLTVAGLLAALPLTAAFVARGRRARRR